MRVLVGVVPLTGHVAPVSGLVGELVGRGHDVRVYTGARHRARFAGLGARVVPWAAASDFDEDDLAASFPRAAGSRTQRMLTLVREGFIGTAPGQVSDLSADLSREPADVLLADSMCFGGVLTGEILGLPWALVNVLSFNQTVGGPPLGFDVPDARGAPGRARDRLLWAGYRVLTSPMKRAYDTARREVGLPASRRPYGGDLMAAPLVLATGCPSLGDAEDRLLPQIHYVGRLPSVGADLPTPQPSTPGRPLVVVTQGTHDVDPGELLRPALTGLADLDVDVLATTGRRGQTDVGIPVPANARVVELADFTTLLPQASVVVSNAGWGGVLAALGAGVPLVLAASTAADKPHIARRVARAGAGVNLRTRKPSPRAVADAVQSMLAEPDTRASGEAARAVQAESTEVGHRQRAAAIAAELTALGGVSRAADLVELLAVERGPVLRPA